MEIYCIENFLNLHTPPVSQKVTTLSYKVLIVEEETLRQDFIPAYDIALDQAYFYRDDDAQAMDSRYPRLYFTDKAYLSVIQEKYQHLYEVFEMLEDIARADHYMSHGQFHHCWDSMFDDYRNIAKEFPWVKTYGKEMYEEVLKSKKSQHYLIHLPHSATEIPDEFINDYLLPADELTHNVYQYCDLYTDELFDDLFNVFGGVKSRYSRLFFDPERFGDDEVEEMHKKHRLGWFYENAILEKKPLRKRDNKAAIRPYFNAHHDELNQKTEEKLSLYGKCTVIDCHSFSDERYWFHDPHLVLPDICIGFEDDHVDKKLVEIIKEEFKEYNIGINTPYSGSLVPTDYWGKDFRVKSVMIEINKRLYLEPDNTTKSINFNIIKRKLNNILQKLDTQ